MSDLKCPVIADAEDEVGVFTGEGGGGGNALGHCQAGAEIETISIVFGDKGQFADIEGQAAEKAV
jgi:hypothetical protein